MSVNWSWKHKRGEIHYYAKCQKQHFKLNLYGGNMMFCILYVYKQMNQETNKLEKWYNFITWFNDITHLKKCLSENQNFFNKLLVGHKNKIIRKFKLKINTNNDYEDNEMLKVAKILVKYGYKVELF